MEPNAPIEGQLLKPDDVGRTMCRRRIQLAMGSVPLRRSCQQSRTRSGHWCGWKSRDDAAVRLRRGIVQCVLRMAACVCGRRIRGSHLSANCSRSLNTQQCRQNYDDPDLHAAYHRLRLCYLHLYDLSSPLLVWSSLEFGVRSDRGGSVLQHADERTATQSAYTSRTVRKLMLVVALSGVFEVRAATRYRLQYDR